MTMVPLISIRYHCFQIDYSVHQIQFKFKKGVQYFYWLLIWISIQWNNYWILFYVHGYIDSKWNTIGSNTW